MGVLFYLLLLLPGIIQAQSSPLPAAYYKLKTAGERAAYLCRMAGDSVHNSRYDQVPYLCHMALAAQSGADTLRPVLYQFLGDAYDGNQPDSAIYYYRLSLTTFKDPPVIKQLYLQQSLLYAFAQVNQKDSMLHYMQQLEQTTASLADTNKNRLNVTNTIAAMYAELNQYDRALRGYQFVIRQSMKIRDSATLRNALVNTGLVYNEIDNDRMAVYYTLQALPYTGDNPNDRMVIYANLSGYYSTLRIADSTKYFLELAEQLAIASKDEVRIQSVRLKRALVLMNESNYTGAAHLLRQSLRYLQPQGPGLDLVNCLMLYATADTALGRYDRAKEHLLLLYETTQKLGKQAYIAAGLVPLIHVYEHLGDYKHAYTFQKRLAGINDSLKTEQTTHELATLQTQYETYKKQEEITSLQKEGRIRSLELRAAIRNKTQVIIICCILFIAAGLILYLFHLRSKTSMKQMKAELEMKALRSQMNPHFIFNSLNSVQKYIWENRREDASEYLTRFARLIRLVLENSLHTSITLAEELKALRLYAEMEHRRNNQRFDYSITTAADIDPDKIWIPPLLLQPYVENAIWHGLSPRDEQGKLSITIERTADTLICTIDDNGIGRKQAALLKTNDPTKTSLAMNISSQRIAWIQKQTGSIASVNITDKYKDGLAIGTTVLMTLPLILKA